MRQTPRVVVNRCRNENSKARDECLMHIRADSKGNQIIVKYELVASETFESRKTLLRHVPHGLNFFFFG